MTQPRKSLVGTFGVAIAVFAPPAAQADALHKEPAPIVIQAGNVWDGKARAALGPMEVLVQGGRIVAMGRVVEHPAGARLINLVNHTLTPGFIDCHVHITMRPETTQHLWSLSAADKAIYGVEALRRLLDRGFTTVRDLADLDMKGYTTVSLQRAVDKGLIPGPRLIVAPHLISPRGGHGDGLPMLAAESHASQVSLADGVEEIRRVVRTEVSRGAQWIKFGATGGFGSPADDPQHVTYSQEEMDVLVQTARDLGVPATPHAYGDEGVRRAVKAGVRSIEHGNLVSLGTLRLLEKKGVYLVPTLSAVLMQARKANDDAYWKQAGRAPYVRAKYRKHAPAILAAASNLAKTQVKVVLGSDIGTRSYSFNSAEEFAELVGVGLPVERALRAGTSMAAEMLGLKDVGVLAPGYQADIVAMPGDPFADIRVTEHVDFVMRAGVIYKTPPPGAPTAP